MPSHTYMPLIYTHLESTHVFSIIIIMNVRSHDTMQPNVILLSSHNASYGGTCTYVTWLCVNVDMKTLMFTLLCTYINICILYLYFILKVPTSLYFMQIIYFIDRLLLTGITLKICVINLSNIFEVLTLIV